jgi:hypothetical protein
MPINFLDPLNLLNTKTKSVKIHYFIITITLIVFYSKVSLEAVNKPFYGFSQYMCNSVEVKKYVSPANV